MAQSNLHQRLALLQHSLKHTAQLIVRLAKTQSQLSHLPQADVATSGDINPGDSHSSLSAEIHETLRQEEEELELLQQDVDDLAPLSNNSTGSRRGAVTNIRMNEREREYSRLCATCNKLREELKLSRVRFRRAQLQSKKNAELAIQNEQRAYLADLQAAAESSLPDGEEREEQSPTHSEMRHKLLNPNRRAGRNTNNSTQEDVLLTASSDLTTSLRRTHDMLSSELSRSRFAHDTLATSNSALQELNKSYGALDGMLSRSRGLLGSLLRSQKSDTWYLETALYLLLATMGWLLFRRLLYGPAWWLVWRPLRLLWSLTSWVSGGFLGLTGMQRGAAAIQTTATKLNAMPSATDMQSNAMREMVPPLAVDDDHQAAESISPSHRSGQHDREATLSEQVGAIIDDTRTGSSSIEIYSTARPTTNSQEEINDNPGKEEGKANEQVGNQDHKDHTGQQNVQRGDGEVLWERDPADGPPNPKKRMWEEPPSKERRKDEL